MDTADLPLALSLLLPGFLLLHLFFFFSRFRRISAFYATTWSLLISLLLFVCIYPPYTAIVSHPQTVAAWPSLLDALAAPQQIPLDVWISLYVSAIVFGWGLGQLEKQGIPGRLLLNVGIDLRRHGDIWERLFRDDQLGRVRVYLKDGEIIAGWPKYYSDDGTDPGPNLYLSPAFIWHPEQETWKAMEDIDGVLIHGSEISRIEFVEIGPEDSVESDEEL